MCRISAVTCGRRAEAHLPIIDCLGKGAGHLDSAVEHARALRATAGIDPDDEDVDEFAFAAARRKREVEILALSAHQLDEPLDPGTAKRARDPEVLALAVAP